MHKAQTEKLKGDCTNHLYEIKRQCTKLDANGVIQALPLKHRPDVKAKT